MVLLEGPDIKVQPGSYFLFAAPINIAGRDGSPAKLLIEDKLIKRRNTYYVL